MESNGFKEGDRCIYKGMRAVVTGMRNGVIQLWPMFLWDDFGNGLGNPIDLNHAAAKHIYSNYRLVGEASGTNK